MGSHIKHLLEHKKELHVFDDVFTLSFRRSVWWFAKYSTFKIGWSDSDVPERKSHEYLHSDCQEKQLEDLGIIKELENSCVWDFIKEYDIGKTVINLSTPSDVNYVHTHPEDKILLYYVNAEWREGWHGETQFYSEDLKQIQFSSPYTPGRLILFDANIPHTIRPQSIIGPQFRFTLAMCLSKKIICPPIDA
jgi:hypothetical protein